MIQVIASLTINPDEPQALNTYFEAAMPLIEQAGAQVLQSIRLGEPVIGETPAELLMLVSYPDHEAVDAVFQSDEYKAIIPARDKAFLKYNVCMVSDIEGMIIPELVAP